MQVTERPAVQTLPAVSGARPAIEVEGLVKRFPAPGGGTLTAVDAISFTVRYGEAFGFLGPNGAGKTTTLDIIEGLQEPTAGRTYVLGFDSVRDRVQMVVRSCTCR